MKISVIKAIGSCLVSVALVSIVSEGASVQHLSRRDTTEIAVKAGPVSVYGGYVSEEEANYECPANSIGSSLVCKGSYCDNVNMGCTSLKDELNNVYTSTGEASTTNVVESGSGAVYCPPNTAAVGFTCAGKHCSEMTLKCKSFQLTARSGQQNPVKFAGEIGNGCDWSEWLTDHNEQNPNFCPDGRFIRGLQARKKRADDLSVLCCSASAVRTL